MFLIRLRTFALALLAAVLTLVRQVPDEQPSNIMNKIVRVVIFGAPGSGKGTISDRIVKNFQIKHIASGDILRANIAKKTELGQTISALVSAGKFVPDDTMNSILLNEMNSAKNESCLLDGYPRTLIQAEKLCENVDINFVINLVVPYEVIINRLKNRWIHLPSGRVYNIGFNNPKVAGLDDVTGEALVQREDDKPEVVEKRLKTYTATSSPVIKFFESTDILKTFKGSTSNEIWGKVYPFLCTELEKRN